MSRAVTIIKIEPILRRVARLSIKPSIRGVRGIIGATNIGHRVILNDVKGEKLVVASRVNVSPDHPFKEWRFRGGDNTVGVGILFGTLNQAMNGMWHCPVDLEWVEKHIVWCEPGEVAPAAEVREHLGLPAPEGQDPTP